MSSLKVYETSHPISRTICRAFVQGVSDFQLVPAISLLEGDAALYGILRGTHEIINECRKQDRVWWYIDHGYLKRSNHQNNDFSGYYRVTYCGYQHTGHGNHDPDRFEDLEVELKPWKRDGNHILVCPMSYNFAVHRGLNHKKWLKETVEEIAKYTDRPITIKPKSSDLTLDEALIDCFAIVGFDTNAMVEAVFKGVPAFNLGDSCVQPVALQDLSRIESPIYPDRKTWCYNLAANQWTLDEMKSGLCWQMLQENLEKNKVPLPQRRRRKNV